MSKSRSKKEIPYVTTKTMVEVDRLMIEVYGIELIQMMENAGRDLAELLRKKVGGYVEGMTIAVASGKGNNGGGGLVAARHLHNWGALVTILVPEGNLKKTTQKQLEILKKLPLTIIHGINALTYLSQNRPDVIVDAMIGYGLKGNPQGWISEMINKINRLGELVISLDVPSGFDSTTGKIYTPCVKATTTLTLALPKIGFKAEKSETVVGELYLGDISVPPSLYDKLGIKVNGLFNNRTIKKINGRKAVE